MAAAQPASNDSSGPGLAPRRNIRQAFAGACRLTPAECELAAGDRSSSADPKPRRSETTPRRQVTGGRHGARRLSSGESGHSGTDGWRHAAHSLLPRYPSTLVTASNPGRWSMTSRSASLFCSFFAWPRRSSAPEPPLARTRVFDLRPQADERTPLANPHKGWYHHFPDNHPTSTRSPRTRTCWSSRAWTISTSAWRGRTSNREEGQFDWPVIDRIIDKWTAHGLGIAFRISCRETSTDRIEQQYATPRWVVEAGAKGGHYPHGQGDRAGGPVGAGLRRSRCSWPSSTASWPPSPPATTASRGCATWTSAASATGARATAWAGSRKECGLAARKRHVDLHLTHFKRSQLVVSDDFVYALSDPQERQALHEYVLTTASAIATTASWSTATWRARATGSRCAARSSSPTPIRKTPDRVRAGALRQR